MSDLTSPRPWRCDHVSRRWVFDASGTEVASCILAEDAALLVEAVNERAALRDLVRRLADRLELERDLEPYDADADALLQEARAAIAAPESPTSLAPTSPEAAP